MACLVLGFWTGKNQTLTPARDRYGIKPLYYVETDARISFASESKVFRKTLVLIGFDKRGFTGVFC